MKVRSALKFVGFLTLFIALTLLTQIGGVVFLIAWLIFRSTKLASVSRWAGIILLFFILHFAATSYIVPPLAKLAGREALSCDPTLDRPYGARSAIYCYAARNYVRPEARAMLDALARDLAAAHPGTVVAYLDTGFPFLDGFPLIPHVTHHDGRKIDLAYFYSDFSGRYLPLTTPSPIGFWGFEQPLPGGATQCPDVGRWTLRWDMEWFQTFVRKDLLLDGVRTGAMLKWLVEQGPSYGVRRILIEPHMAARLGVTSPLIRFQGCRAGRHDDHVHIVVDTRG